MSPLEACTLTWWVGFKLRQAFNVWNVELKNIGKNGEFICSHLANNIFSSLSTLPVTWAPASTFGSPLSTVYQLTSPLRQVLHFQDSFTAIFCKSIGRAKPPTQFDSPNYLPQPHPQPSSNHIPHIPIVLSLIMFDIEFMNVIILINMI